jgi:hypothetical protein
VRTIALSAVLMSAPTAFAADQGFYFGVNVGQAKYDFDPVRVPVVMWTGGWGAASNPGDAQFGAPVEAFNPFTPLPNFRTPSPILTNPPFGAVRASAEIAPAYWIPGEEDDATAWSALAGYRIFDYAAVEVAYVDLGSLSEFQPARSFTPIIGLPITLPEVERELETTAPTISALGILPVTDSWDVFLRLGWYFADQKVTFRSPAYTGSRKTYGTDGVLFGAGTQYNFGEHWTVRLDFQRLDDVGENNGFGSSDIDVLSLGVLFRL